MQHTRLTKDAVRLHHLPAPLRPLLLLHPALLLLPAHLRGARGAAEEGGGGAPGASAGARVVRQGAVRVDSVLLPDTGDVQLRHEHAREVRVLQGVRGVPERQVRSVQRLRGFVVWFLD